MVAAASKAEQSERTRRALLDAARELFAEQGYADTSTEEVVRRAGVTRGALYYHFHDKAMLFKAVYQGERTALVQYMGERIRRAEGDTWQRIVVTASTAFLERAADPSVQRILYVDGPAVLDWDVTHGPAPALTLLRDMFERLMAEGMLEPLPLDPLISLLWATFFEAVGYIAHADDSATAQEEMVSMLLRILTGLRPVPEQECCLH